MGSNSSIPAKYDSQANGCLSAFLVLTTIAIIARGVSRGVSKAAFGADDALAYLAYVTNAASLINELVEAGKGIFDLQRLATFTPAVASSIQKHIFASAFLYIVTITSAKISILCLFRRTFYLRTGWFTGFWWINFLLLLPCWAVATLCILIYVQIDEFAYTKPINAYGTVACALVNAISDVMVLILPIREVLNMQLPRHKRYAIAGLFSLGFL
ncbi:hypothetical protein SLS60_008419 [Paraconiothyrium brasiliense]|uniref:Rhodopsin domain-containing protein n=1 Tax=Paraconiothyrium brasiliense TaxID=300254 RepID=A0ABR3R0J0_9PLEO